MITTRSWTMSITQMLRSPVAVFLTIASCVAGAPVQIEGENIGLGQAVYSQPELAEALARTYEALEWQERIRKNQEEARNLDHIGGGNLIRNLDHIGGGNLLRDLEIETNEQSRSGKNGLPKDGKFNHEQTPRPPVLKDDPSTWPESCQTLDAKGGSNILCRAIVNTNKFERNLDHIGGGNLLRDLGFQKFASSRLIRSKPLIDEQINQYSTIRRPDLVSRFNNDQSQWSINRGTLDSIGRGNLLGLNAVTKNEHARTLDRIGGANLLRDLERSRTARSEQSTEERVQSSGQNPGSVIEGFQDDSSNWVPQRKNLDEIDEEYGFQRNLDHIGRGNLLRDLGIGAYRTVPLMTLRNKNSSGALDGIGGGVLIGR